MAKLKTMVSAEICQRDDFIDMSFEAQALYLQLNLSADNYGVVSSVKQVLRGGGFNNDSLQELLDAGFVIELEGNKVRVAVVTHWWDMNRLDRKNNYVCSYKGLLIDEICVIGRTYFLKSCLPIGYELTGFAGEIDDIEEAKPVPDGYQTGTRREPDYKGKEGNGKEGNGKEGNGKEGNGNEGIGTETNTIGNGIDSRANSKADACPQFVRDLSVRCPKCGNQALQSTNPDGSPLFDCSQCGLFTVTSDGEFIPY